jgi:putative redox protein
MKAVGTWMGGFETRLEDGRGHTVTIDLDREEGGADRGPSGLELCVLSLAGCITTIFALVAKKRRLSFESMRVDLEAQRPRGSPTIASVEGTFHLTSRADPGDVATALELTLRTCPVGVLFERAHVPVHVRAVVQAPEVPGARDGHLSAPEPEHHRSHAHPSGEPLSART